MIVITKLVFYDYKNVVTTIYAPILFFPHGAMQIIQEIFTHILLSTLLTGKGNGLLRYEHRLLLVLRSTDSATLMRMHVRGVLNNP
jgi:hypothetical protein